MRRATLTATILAASLLVYRPFEAKSWQAITHYQLGVEAGVDSNRQFQMLPDSWPSHGSIFKLFEITEWFAWSHAVQRTGRTDGVQNVPIYPNDDRNPGEVMYKLYKQGQAAGSYPYETALGFLTHNAQDRQVHYAYFRGGSRAAWVEEHQYKENWADCWIYRIKLNGTFDERGRPLNLPIIQNIGNATLISKAQADFVASGRSTDSDQMVTLPKTETEQEIQTRMSDAEKETREYLDDFDETKCDALAKYAKNYAWTLDELKDYYSKSLNETSSTLRAHPR